MTDEILGIDLSKWRPNLSMAEFEKLHAAGCRFLGLRVSSGTTFDETLVGYTLMARELGWVVMGYHYLTAAGLGQDAAEWGAEQGRTFARALSTAPPLDGHFLDVEDSGLKWATVIHAAERIRALTDLPLLGYSRQSYYSPKFGDKPAIFDGWWWADYRGGSRWLTKWPTPESAEKWRPGPLWQWTDELKYRIPETGKKRSIDGNVFLGTQKQLLDHLQGNQALRTMQLATDNL